MDNFQTYEKGLDFSDYSTLDTVEWLFRSLHDYIQHVYEEHWLPFKESADAAGDGDAMTEEDADRLGSILIELPQIAKGLKIVAEHVSKGAPQSVLLHVLAQRFQEQEGIAVEAFELEDGVMGLRIGNPPVPPDLSELGDME